MPPAKTAPEAAATPDDQADELTRVKAELAALKRKNAQPPDPAEVKPPRDTHALVLSNGSVVNTPFPGATHHTTEDGVFLVVGRHELPREED